MSLKKSIINFTDFKAEGGKNIYSIQVDDTKIKFHTVDHIAEYLCRHKKDEPIEFFWNTSFFGKIYVLSIRLQNGQVLSAAKEGAMAGVFIYILVLYGIALYVPLFIGYFLFAALNEMSADHIFTVPLFLSIFLAFLYALKILKRGLDAKAANGKLDDIKSRGEKIFGY